MIFRTPYPRLALVLSLLILAACAGQETPLALQPVHPDLDESGVMRELVAADAGQPVTFLQAVLKQGVPLKVAKQALLKYDRFSSRVSNKKYIVMIDMTQHSGQKRFYMVNRASGKVDALTAAHGAGSDPKDTGYAKYFSNVPDSHMTSLGSYLIEEKYKGKYGESLKLDGLERSNLNVRDRSIVLHPAPYVKDGKNKQGRSWGCPAIPTGWIKKAIERLAGGAFMYVYGENKRDSSTDRYWMNQWNLIPKSSWPNESDDAPFDGE